MNLFDPVITEEKMHPNLRSTMSTGNACNMDVLQYSARDFVDRERKLVEEFQATFNSSFWELYLYAVVVEAAGIEPASTSFPLEVLHA